MRKLVWLRDDYEWTTRRRLADYLGTLVPGGVTEGEISRAIEAMGLDLEEVTEDDIKEAGAIPDPEIVPDDLRSALLDEDMDVEDMLDEVKDLKTLAAHVQAVIIRPPVPRGKKAAPAMSADEILTDVSLLLGNADAAWTGILDQLARLGIELPTDPKGQRARVYGYVDGRVEEDPFAVVRLFTEWVDKHMAQGLPVD